MGFLNSKSKAGERDKSGLPRHIAIILDGNGRWAKKRGMPRTAGHAAGADAFRRIARCCRDLGVGYLTVYAFSTENWKRSEEEVSAIMQLLGSFLREAVDTMAKDNYHVRIFGDVDALSPQLRELAAKAESVAAHVGGMQINVCINYGGRAEIVRAAKAWAADPAKPELTEETFSRYLYSDGVPDPDLVIRPSGEMRLSNFLLWQSAYAELYFTDTLWPDFGERELMKAIDAYRRRDRRFGGVKG